MSLFGGRYVSPLKNDGTQNVGGKVYFYETATSTLKPAYSDEALTTAHANPVILDSAGSALIFLGSGSYDYKVDDSDDASVVATQGPVTISVNPSITTGNIKANQKGLIITNNATNPDYQVDIDVSWLDLLDDDGAVVQVSNVDLTLDMTTDLESGSEAANTWYKIYVTYNGVTVTGYFVADGSDITYQNDVIYARHVGYIYNTGASDFEPFYQDNALYFLMNIGNVTSSEMHVSMGDIDTTWTDVTVLLPEAITTGDFVMKLDANSSSAASELRARVNGSADAGIPIAAANGTEVSFARAFIPVDSNKVFEIRNETSDTHTVTVYFAGFTNTEL